MGILLLLPLLWAVLFVAHVARVDAGFPHKRVVGKSRIEGPVVPAPKNWGYRPTRWIRWETDIIHPSLGPVAPDAKKEMKAPDADETGAAETTASGAARSNSEEISPSTDRGSEMLPPLPSDDGPPATPSNMDEDLPPLPGDNFNPPSSNPTPVTEKQSPESSGPSGTPSFRDPDAIFDKSDGRKTPQATPGVLPPLPGSDPPKASPNTVPQPTAPEPSPIQPPPTQPLPTQPPPTPPLPTTPLNQTQTPTPTEPPAEQQPKWEKRTREKPVDPQEIQKQTPKQKPGEPFYDPDSIFDDRATRNQGPAKVRWQKAGTVSQPASSIEKHTTNQKAIPRQRQERVFSQVKPAKITTINRASIPSIQGSQPESTGTTTIAAPALFEAERPRRIRSQQPTWRPAKSANQPVTNPPPIRQDHLVRPATFDQPIDQPIEQPIEQPIKKTPAKNPPLRPTAPTVNDNVSAPRKAGRAYGPKPSIAPATASFISAATINAARKNTVVGKKASVDDKTLASQSETGLPVLPTESLRNPMREPVREQEQLSEDNPLREKNQPVAESPAKIVSKLSNPLR